MNPPDDAKLESWHRFFGSIANNRAWSLAELPADEVDRDELLNAAHAAAWHWGQIGTELHRMRATMLLAEAHAKAGLGASALAYAERMRAYFLAATNTPDWEIAFVHVLHAHASAVAGAAKQHADSYARAETAVGAIREDEDREIVARVFRHVPKP